MADQSRQQQRRKSRQENSRGETMEIKRHGSGTPRIHGNVSVNS